MNLPLDQRISTKRRTSPGYWVGQLYRGRGLAKLAARSLIENAFCELDLNRVDIRCAASNRPSQRVAESLGLKFEGTLREAENLYGQFVDHQIYSVLRREWWSEAESYRLHIIGLRLCKQAFASVKLMVTDV